jgi:phosphate transport system substrate-binding protein
MMKTSALLALLLLCSLASQSQNTSVSGTVKLRGTRLTYPLVRQWIATFKKDYPNVNVSIAQDAPADSIDLLLAAHSIIEEDLKGNKDYVAVSRYVQLPVVNDKNPNLKELQTAGFRESDFRNVYFSNGNKTFQQTALPITVYNRERPTCATITVARHFGNDEKTLNGNPVKGDDQDLLNAVKTDVNGISFNNLGFIYNLQTRKINPDIAIIPLDLNENGKIDSGEAIYETLDEVVSYVEKTNNKKFIAENVNVLFKKETKNQAAGIFLNWALAHGQQYNHDFGFLNLESKIIAEQQAIISKSFKVSSVSSCSGLDEISQQRKLKALAKN